VSLPNFPDKKEEEMAKLFTLTLRALSDLKEL